MKNDPTVVPAKIIAKSDLVVTITYDSTSAENPYRLTIVKNIGPEMGYFEFDTFGELTEFLDNLCDEACGARDDGEFFGD